MHVPSWVPSGKRQDIRSLGRHRNRVFEVRREAAVTGDRGPAVLADGALGPALVDHRLDREHEALLELRAPGARAVVRDLGLLVELAPDAVTDELADDGVPGPFGHVLDRARDVGHVVAGPDLLDPRRERAAGGVH